MFVAESYCYDGLWFEVTDEDGTILESFRHRDEAEDYLCSVINMRQ